MTELIPIGRVHTPYKNTKPPRQSVLAEEKGPFIVEVFEEYAEGLANLDEYSHIHVLYHADRPTRDLTLTVSPPWANGETKGLFASRSPVRPNPINLCVVRIEKIDGRLIHTSALDALDGSPLIDIKPYIPELDLAARDAKSPNVMP